MTVVRSVVVSVVMRHDIRRVPVHYVVMVPANHMTMRILHDVIVVIDVISGTVVDMLRFGHSGTNEKYPCDDYND